MMGRDKHKMFHLKLCFGAGFAGGAAYSNKGSSSPLGDIAA